MAKILKGIYALIIFLFLILLVTGEDLIPIISIHGHHVPCITFTDCPQEKCQDPSVLWCVSKKCYCS
ncbi:unnamed protein product [Trifolium pratense]|uniref:Uncharacterized protein n=1 Tax=Trifolium pratense TaxID=57577 RepID=A0ACB0KL07_TRIPR|nr:unnamed protein product [Trifolium pratense]